MVRTETKGKGDKQSMLRKVLCRQDYGEEIDSEENIWRSEIRGARVASPAMPLSPPNRNGLQSSKGGLGKREETGNGEASWAKTTEEVKVLERIPGHGLGLQEMRVGGPVLLTPQLPQVPTRDGWLPSRTAAFLLLWPGTWGSCYYLWHSTASWQLRQ